MRDKVASAEQEVARIAARQHGVISIEQLLAIGFSRQAVSRRVAKGLLHREFRGVYRVGHQAPGTEARYLGAVLACGVGAALSGRAAAFLFGLIGGPPPPPEVSTRSKRRVPGVITHSVRLLDPRDLSEWRAVPITTVPRTLVDLATDLSLDSLARVCHEAQVRHRVGAPAIEATLERRPQPTAAARLRPIFSGDARTTLSKLERDFLALLRSAGLQLPRTNLRMGARYVDCRWPELRLTVELDGYRYHHTRLAWEEDRRREREARARGDEFRRYTYGDVVESRGMVLEELRQLLDAAGS